MAVDDLYTKSLLHFDGSDTSTTFTDESGKVWTARGNAQLDTAKKKFGTASALFDGTGDRIDTPDHADWHLAALSFTWDAWVLLAANNTAYRFAGRGSDAGAANIEFWFGKIAAGNVVQGVLSNGTTTYTATAGALTDTTNFHHVAYVRNGNNFGCAVDGVFGSWTDVTGVTVQDLGGVMSIGGQGTYTTGMFAGQLDESRWSLGIARWTANFTPPTMAYYQMLRFAQAVAFF